MLTGNEGRENTRDRPKFLYPHRIPAVIGFKKWPEMPNK
jgi:hypothetical protein